MNHEAYLARDRALTKAEGTERAYRRIVNAGTYFAAAIYLMASWRTIGAQHVVASFLGVPLLRVIGNAFVNAWCDREVQRIKDAIPLDGSVPPIGETRKDGNG